MTDNHRLMTREHRTVEAMIDLYCGDQHGRRQDTAGTGLCPECEALRAYARQRAPSAPSTATSLK